MISNTPIFSDVKNAFPAMGGELVVEFCGFLETIECPPDFRGLQRVLRLIEELCDEYDEEFEQCFSIKFDGELKDIVKEGISESYQDTWNNAVKGAGWLKDRPLFGLLFEFNNKRPHFEYFALLNFLHHYIHNKAMLLSIERCEQSCRAMRIIFFHRDFEQDCLIADHPKQIAKNLVDFQDELDEDSDFKKNYLLDLIHFFSLDWEIKQARERSSSGGIVRGRNKPISFEPYTSDDQYYLLQLISRQQQDREELEGGLCAEEDLPAICILKEAIEDTLRSEYEQASVTKIY
ncbi:MAG: hypothetical protein GY912_04985, partial [Candidatus Marinimicrobia bacterium]|nr:hypothetical protein [Candidatus Neomarinimicrobiota bacterium]